ncbi:hypothetical protein KIN20_034465 [Parelaphostrongylus tenuis]|nr:hypothetical protein KIN20_034465 [Parelaphostrongylus tenuis]
MRFIFAILLALLFIMHIEAQDFDANAPGVPEVPLPAAGSYGFDSLFATPNVKVISGSEESGSTPVYSEERAQDA